ncbi:hypothetical protein GCM10029976_010840 [Kribbella albertanoniae]|uniref:Uncharacterized protein n=1 Tax=Kribbella albertanoniae TaxID=1266829 RepID=A0A4R4PNE9_9ACTN|nr:hypothetical protein [Kribbella albertanoniae]TDC23563.1 hypothetical protein E1261_28160 [Kribbella albertanoniae]
MTTRLDPPQVPPLTPDQHARLRRRVMNKTRPARGTTSRRWVPAVAVAAVAAIAIGAVAIGRPDGNTPPVTRSSTPKPSQPAVKTVRPATPPPSMNLAIPTDIDLGPAASPAAAAAKSCMSVGKQSTVLWARQVKGIAPGSKAVVLLLKGPAQPGDVYRQGIWLCQAGAMVQPVRDSDWAKQPTATKGLAVLTAGGFSTGSTVSAQSWTIYRAHPQIDRIETRYVWKGGSGPWVKGVVDGGFAYTDTRVKFPGKTPAGLTHQLRAFDAAGKVLQVNPW